MRLYLKRLPALLFSRRGVKQLKKLASTARILKLALWWTAWRSRSNRCKGRRRNDCHRRLSLLVRQLEIALSFIEYSGLIKDRKVLSRKFKDIRQEEERLDQGLKRQRNMIYQAKQSLSQKQDASNQLQSQATDIAAKLSSSQTALKYQRAELIEIRERLAQQKKR